MEPSKNIKTVFTLYFFKKHIKSRSYIYSQYLQLLIKKNDFNLNKYIN